MSVPDPSCYAPPDPGDVEEDVEDRPEWNEWSVRAYGISIRVDPEWLPNAECVSVGQMYFHGGIENLRTFARTLRARVEAKAAELGDTQADQTAQKSRPKRAGRS